MNSLKGANTIIVRSSKDNTSYNKLKNLATSNDQVKKLLQQHKINIVEDISSGSKDFNLYLYGDNGILYKSMNSFDDNSFQELFSTFEAANKHLQTIQKGGEQEYYKHKFQKYKHKYDILLKSKRT